MNPRRLRTAVAGLTLAMACDHLSVVCTTIGCANHLEVKFDRAPAFPYQVELTTPDNIKHTITCESAALCPATSVGFANLTPATAIVTVTTPTGTTTTSIQPSYTTTNPNGERCGPACKQGSVTVPISGP